LHPEYLGETWTRGFTKEPMLEWLGAWGIDNYYYGIVENAAGGESIGIAGISENTDPNETGMEFSWFIKAKHQNKGYASEITRELLGFAFGHPGFE